MIAKILPNFLRLRLAKWGVKQALQLGFHVMPARRALAARQYAEHLNHLVRSKGPQFRNREVRRAGLQFTDGVVTNLRLGQAEMQEFLTDAKPTD